MVGPCWAQVGLLPASIGAHDRGWVFGSRIDVVDRRGDAGGVLDTGTQEWMIKRRGGECPVAGVLVVGGVGGHDTSRRSGSVRRRSDVRVSRSQVGDAQDGAPD